METTKGELTINVSFDFDVYEENVRETIKDAIMTEVRAETKRQARCIREAIAQEFKNNRKELIDRAVMCIPEIDLIPKKLKE